MAKKDKTTAKIPPVRPTGQTDEARITANGRVIAEHPSHQITPAKMRLLFEDAESGDITAQHELFLDIEERDSAVASALQTRKMSVLGLDWQIAEPPQATDAETRLAEEVRGYMQGLADFDDMLLDLMDAVGHGFAALEITWQFSGGLQLPQAFKHTPQSWFRWDKHDNLLLKTPDNPMGEPLWPYGWVVHRHKTRSHQAARNGLFRTLAWLYMFKHYSVHDFAEFLELYGLPIRIGKYPAGATEKEKRTLLRAVAEIGHNAAGIMPEGMMIELHQAANGTTAANNPFMTMVEWCEKSATRLILGQTLTSGADGRASTNALGKIHNEVRRDLTVSDAKRLAQTINRQLIEPFVQVNFAHAADVRLPVFEFDTRETADLATVAEALPKLVDVGMQIPEGWARDKLAIPEAAEGERVLGRAAAKPPAAALNYRVADLAAKQPHADLHGSVEDYLQQAALQAQLEPMVQALGKILAESQDYEDVENRLIAAYPDLDTRLMQEALGRVLFVADIWGRKHG